MLCLGTTFIHKALQGGIVSHIGQHQDHRQNLIHHRPSETLQKAHMTLHGLPEIGCIAAPARPPSLW